MIVALSIVKYKTAAIPFAFIGMAILRFPLYLNQKCHFWKLLGSGKNASVDLPPDFKHWGVLSCWENQDDFNEFYQKSFVMKWLSLFKKDEFTILLNPLSSHGLWSGIQPFKVDKTEEHYGRIAVITRATIKCSKIKEFQQNIKKAADAMRNAPGFIVAAGIGEAPFFRQATFSVWENTEAMKNYAYKNLAHSDVIKLTRARKWYSEELFARFEIIDSWGALNGFSLPQSSL